MANDLALLGSLRRPDNGPFDVTPVGAFVFDGSFSLRVTFTQPSQYYELYFDLGALLGQTTGWAGSRFSCRVQIDGVRTTTAWAGMVVKDAEYRNDYGADYALGNLTSGWAEFGATVGAQGEPTVHGGVATFDDRFSPASLNGIGIFFNTGDNNDQLVGRVAYVDACGHG